MLFIHRMIRISFLAVVLCVVLLPGPAVQAQQDGSQEYREVIAMADEYYRKGDYINAKSSYQYASRMNPEDQYPRDRLEKTVAKLREKMAKMDDYTAVLTEADNYYRKKEFDKAIEKYRAAARIIPGEGYPEQKIKEIEGAKDAERQQQIAYDDALSRADKYVKYRKYEEALGAYREALEIKPGEAYPNEQIGMLEGELEALVEARNAYQETIENADRLFGLKYYENARSEYQKAADARPDDDYPALKISEIDKLLEKKAEYDQLVNKGDEFYMNKNLPGAKQSYQQALAIYPSESYPRDMIDRVNEAMKKQIGADELYQVAIANADKFMAASDYANALQEYANASDLKPAAAYPRQKVEEINNLLEARKEADRNFEAAVSMGDQYLNGGAYADAKVQFEKALAIKPGETYPAERLSVALNALNDQRELQASYEKSMNEGEQQLEAGAYDAAISSFKNALIIVPGDAQANERIKVTEQRRAQAQKASAQYNSIIADADRLLAARNLMAARDKYEIALSIDPGASYPAERIAEIDGQLETQRTANAGYNKAIAAGDIYFNNKEYERARAEYEKAASIKPNESYPVNRLEEIAAATAAAAAAVPATVPANTPVTTNATATATATATTTPATTTGGTTGGTTVLASIPAPQDDEYTKILKEADGLMGLQEYDKARLLYMKAANMRPKEQYPKDKLEEIDLIESKQASEEAEYNRLISAGDRMLEAGNYDMARERYNEALELRPTEQYPHDKLKVIDELILAGELNTQKAYNQLVEEADKLFALKDYEPARIKYQNALKYKPDEPYPQEKINELDQLSSDLKKRSDQYNKLIVEGDNAFTSRNYETAKAKYSEAIALFPEEEHPRVRLEEINLINRASNTNASQAYDKTIADADKFFSTGAYGQALDSYRRASAMAPDEAYPQQMIEKILKILNDNAFRKLITSSKSIQNGEVQELKFDPISVTDRKNSILLIRARGMGIRDFKVFVSYGKGGSKNGGFIMPVKAGEEMKEYVFELGSQYTWFSEDNNWISLTPQGGSIEVTLVEIAKSGAE